jgi:cytochrome c oxidase assembly protein subunit 20
MYQWCLYRRQAEKDGMMRAVEILNKKEIEKRAREAQKEKAREERRRRKEEEQDKQFAALREKHDAAAGSQNAKPWWKLW